MIIIYLLDYTTYNYWAYLWRCNSGGEESSSVVSMAAFKRSSSVLAASERVRPERSWSSNAARVYSPSHARGESGDTCGDGGGGFCQLAVASAAMKGGCARRGGIVPRARFKLAGRAPPPSRSVSVRVPPAPVRHDLVRRPSGRPTDRVVIVFHSLTVIITIQRYQFIINIFFYLTLLCVDSDTILFYHRRQNPCPNRVESGRFIVKQKSWITIIIL